MYPTLPFGETGVSSYALLFILGASLTLLLGLKRAKLSGLPIYPVYLISLAALAASVAGARILYALTEPAYYAAHPEALFSLSQGGYSFHGGLMAGTALVFLLAGRQNLPPLRLLDAFAPGMALGHGVGKLGCLAAGCCHGTPSNLPWAATFTHSAALAPLNLPLHPTQAYEALFLLGLSLWLFRKGSETFAAYAGGYAALRFFAEFYRGDAIFTPLPLTFSQLISLVLIIAAILIAQRQTGRDVQRETT